LARRSFEADSFPRFLSPRALYIHVPVCASKCSYCDFHSLAVSAYSTESLSALVDATLSRVDELALRFRADDRNGYDTVYIGGGTPSALPRGLLARLVRGVAQRAGKPREWTVEANPESLDESFLEIVAGAGCTRISVGIQSFDDELLAILGRPADSKTARKALELVGRSGLAFSADLIAGLSRKGSLAEEALAIVDSGAAHLSIYDLVLEDGTSLSARAARGDVPLLDEDQAFEERAACEAELAGRGYRRYEVSNYALPDSECRHNLAYWNMDSYLGAGPGAVSTLAGGGRAFRIAESRDHAAYLRGAAAAAAAEEAIPCEEAAFEVLLMSFRTIFGLDLDAFRERFGIDAREVFPLTFETWKARLAPRGENRLALDGKGLDLLNRFLVECLEELERRGDCFPHSVAVPSRRS